MTVAMDRRSIAFCRALAGNEVEVSESEVNRGGGLPVWWGPIVETEPGDRIIYFESPLGIIVEGVIRAKNDTGAMA